MSAMCFVAFATADYCYCYRSRVSVPAVGVWSAASEAFSFVPIVVASELLAILLVSYRCALVRCDRKRQTGRRSVCGDKTAEVEVGERGSGGGKDARTR